MKNTGTLVLLAFLSIFCLVGITGCGGQDAQKQTEYNQLKTELQQSIDKLVGELTDSRAQAIFTKIDDEHAKLAEIEKEYADALTAGSDAVALSAIAERYGKQIDEVAQATTALMKKIEDAQVEVAATIQVMEMQYRELLIEDQNAVLAIIEPVNNHLQPVQKVAETLAPVLLLTRQGVLDRVQNGGEQYTEELHQEELQKAIEAVLSEKAGQK